MRADAVATIVVVVILAAAIALLVAREMRRSRRCPGDDRSGVSGPRHSSSAAGAAGRGGAPGGDDQAGRAAGSAAGGGPDDGDRGPGRGPLGGDGRPGAGDRVRLLSRREALDRGLVGMFAVGLAAMTAAVVRFLWPSLQGRSGTRFVIGDRDDLRRRLADGRNPYYDDNGRFFVVPYPAEDLTAASQVYPPEVLAGMRVGFVALSQRCPHQGCAVPWCSSSQWFECPCHGSKFNRVGEQRTGPAPRGMYHYLLTVDAQHQVIVDTRREFLGPAVGVDTTGQAPAGPHCV